MGTIVESKKGSYFTPHEAGNFMGVCADAYTVQQPNKYKGQLQKFGKNKGKPDERDFIEKACISFLTTEAIEIDGDLKPRMVSFWAPASLGSNDYPSKLRTFIKGWFPKLTDADFDRFDLDKLVGRPAWLTIEQNVVGEKTYANIVTASTPPPGTTAPMIPADFVRHEAKEAAKAQAANAEPSHIASEDDHLVPF